jgi:DNA-directed RNA polymerase beta' subunit
MHLLDTDTLTHLHAGHPRVIEHLRELAKSIPCNVCKEKIVAIPQGVKVEGGLLDPEMFGDALYHCKCRIWTKEERRALLKRSQDGRCPKCGGSLIQDHHYRQRMAHIELAAPVVNPLFLREGYVGECWGEEAEDFAYFRKVWLEEDETVETWEDYENSPLISKALSGAE